jgi:hypothetical protein
MWLRDVQNVLLAPHYWDPLFYPTYSDLFICNRNEPGAGGPVQVCLEAECSGHVITGQLRCNFVYPVIS